MSAEMRAVVSRKAMTKAGRFHPINVRKPGRVPKPVRAIGETVLDDMTGPAMPRQPSLSRPSRALPFPKFVEPQFAKLVDVPPLGSDWVHEIKLDGYRLQLQVV